MKLWKSKKNTSNTNVSNNTANTTTSCVPGKSSSNLSKNGDSKIDSPATSSTTVLGKLSCISKYVQSFKQTNIIEFNTWKFMQINRVVFCVLYATMHKIQYNININCDTVFAFYSITNGIMLHTVFFEHKTPHILFLKKLNEIDDAFFVIYLFYWLVSHKR